MLHFNLQFHSALSEVSQKCLKIPAPLWCALIKKKSKPPTAWHYKPDRIKLVHKYSHSFWPICLCSNLLSIKIIRSGILIILFSLLHFIFSKFIQDKYSG